MRLQKMKRLRHHANRSALTSACMHHAAPRALTRATDTQRRPSLARLPTRTVLRSICSDDERWMRIISGMTISAGAIEASRRTQLT
jgi:hypothetical protein